MDKRLISPYIEIFGEGQGIPRNYKVGRKYCRVMKREERRKVLKGKVKLKEIAHSRAGDKGNISNLSLIAYDRDCYKVLEKIVKGKEFKKRLVEHFKGLRITEDNIEIYETSERLMAFNIVMTNALHGGVTASLRLDAHGKTLSSHLLEMEFEVYQDFCQD